MTSSFDATRGVARSYFIAGAMALVLTACGGGGSSTPEPTALPASLTVSGPATRQSVGGNIEFSSNGSTALSYQWSFGDGTTSTSATPSHAYASAGVYTVNVTVTNEAGAKAQTTFTVSVANTAVVQGKICNGAAGSGWCWQRPLPQGNGIVDTAYLDDKHGWAVGEQGTILATADAGATWTAQQSGTTLRLNAVSFVNANVGWVAANNGTLLRTTDGGSHWSAVSIGSPDPVASVVAIDANTAWANSYYYGLMLTTDAGVHWTTVSYAGSVQRYLPVSTSDVWALPYPLWGINSQTLVHSSDAGKNWATVSIPAPTASNLAQSISDMRFTDAVHGWVLTTESGYDNSLGYYSYVSHPVGYRTADGGASWQMFDADPFKLAGTTPYYWYSGNFQFINSSTAFARSGYDGSFKRTTDGGASWQSVALPDSVVSYGATLRAFSANVIQAQDSNGVVWVTADAGAHWDKRSEGNLPSLNSVWFFSTKDGLAIADNGASVRTTDGGVTWTTTTPNSYYGWRRMQFLDDGSVGWVISDTGTIYRSTDKGKSWLAPVPQTSAPLYQVNDFHFVDANNGWAVTYSGSFYRSTDGGTSWQAVAGVSSYNYAAIRFADATHGVAVGPAGVALVTSDAGATWQPRPTNVTSGLQRITFVDANTAIAVGDSGVIVRSTDRGQNWTSISSPTTAYLRDVRFLNASFGYAVGWSGTVITTHDGGLSWSALATGAMPALRAAFFTDEQTGWAVGDNGTILVTATGGR